MLELILLIIIFVVIVLLVDEKYWLAAHRWVRRTVKKFTDKASS